VNEFICPKCGKRNIVAKHIAEITCEIEEIPKISDYSFLMDPVFVCKNCNYLLQLDECFTYIPINILNKNFKMFKRDESEFWEDYISRCYRCASQNYLDVINQ